MQNKKSFIKDFIPDERLEDIHFVQIDLDITDLSIADILRNINKSFPLNSRDRNKIKSGQKVLLILCKSELLEPLSGLMILIGAGDLNVNILSRNYIIISIDENMIIDDESISKSIDMLSDYLIASYHTLIPNFNDFYIKFIYDIDSDNSED